MMKPWLWLPAEVSQALAPVGLKILGAGKKMNIPKWRPFQWKGLFFENRLGLAAGVDKNATQINDWWKFGAGFLEVGTIVPLPQKPNPGKIIERDTKTFSVWNKMGFPSDGVEAVKSRLLKINNRQTPIFLNIGKNRATSNAEAPKDYAHCFSVLYDVGDAFVVNISSPNTLGLRELFSPDSIKRIISPLNDFRSKRAVQKPILLKLSPDNDTDSLEAGLETCCNLGVDGFVLTNTTLWRPDNSRWPKEGGLSGAPLGTRSLNCLKNTLSILGDRRKDKLIISVGGVFSPEHVVERLNLGADLVQVYSKLVFDGPNFFNTTAKKMENFTT